MPVGTVGSVKAVTQLQLKEEVNAQIILGNTYHLYLRPSTEILEAAGGLHKFIGWDRPILTDSGGYQVFSLAANRKITEEGALFQSHIDGSRHLFTPEKVMDIQRSIGGDIIMAFDECPPYPSEYRYAQKSMELTHRWLDRCFDRFNEMPDKYGYSQNLFPIVQGSTFKDLRTASSEYIASKNAAGNAIGGLSVGEPEQMMYDFTELCCDILPANKPRYLMGVGTPWNILENISLGVDMFDCVMPTRAGRTGRAFTSRGVLNMRNARHMEDPAPIDPACDCPACARHSRAYLHHLFRSEEMLGPTLLTWHNLSYYQRLMRGLREAIVDGNFAAQATSIRAGWGQGGPE